MDKQLPTQILLEWINTKVWIILKSQREFVGIMKGIDEYTNIILQDCIEYEIKDNKESYQTQHKLILVSGNGIDMISKGEKTDL
ncbi:LSM domain containing protein [Entamoeba histolytica HM-3:IMSS]|uniref:LSM domain containing protein n=1 Tax=Entamoeba histolytica HM-3:IMSS TaxID=885315 RepID=M7WLK3_ENTHI|nr:LSM domain containing protein [Entamoeba histolytica HM-3:IMSS]